MWFNKPSRPYIVSAGLEDGVKYIFTMNPYMSELLSTSEFIETDITYNVSTEFTYLYNAVAFDYHLMEWEVVARVHLSHQNGDAHALAFTKMFKNAKWIISISSQLKFFEQIGEMLK